MAKEREIHKEIDFWGKGKEVIYENGSEAGGLKVEERGGFLGFDDKPVSVTRNSKDDPMGSTSTGKTISFWMGGVWIIIIVVGLIVPAMSTQPYTIGKNSNSCLTVKQQPKSLLSDDSLVARAKTWCQTEFYSDIEITGATIGNVYYPPGAPIGNKSPLLKGEVVEIYNIFPNDLESRYTLKIKTNKGIIGYMLSYVEIINTYGEKGELLSIYLSLPYEYEGDMELLKKDISKLKTFIDNYPNSSFIPEILNEIQWRQEYGKIIDEGFLKIHDSEKAAKKALGI